ncbi:cytochrome P450 [Mycena polygramma]|nr:cytochrome P450 [Mycena polygramma]
MYPPSKYVPPSRTGLGLTRTDASIAMRAIYTHGTFPCQQMLFFLALKLVAAVAENVPEMYSDFKVYVSLHNPMKLPATSPLRQITATDVRVRRPNLAIQKATEPPRHFTLPLFPLHSRLAATMIFTVHYAVALAVLVSSVAVYFTSRPKSVIARIAGPPSPSWLFGHMSQLILSPQYGDYEFGWQKLYGLVYLLRGCFGENRLMVSDPVALQYLVNSPVFARGPGLDGLMTVIFTRKSVITAPRDEHRRLRSALNVGFTVAAVKKCQPIFESVAEKIADQLEKSTTVSTNICPILSTGTLAAISEAVLGSSLEDLGEEFVKSNVDLCELIATQSKTQLLADGIAAHFPSWFWDALLFLPTTSAKVLRKERYLTDRLGRRVVGEKMAAIAQGLEINNDVYSQLLNPEAADGTRKLSEADVAAQTSVVVLAGQETTANAMAFALLELARRPDLQDKLRNEIHSMLGVSGSHAYDNMPLLNAVIKETLRLYPAIPFLDRIALEDTVIPLSEAITTSTGEIMDQIPVTKGQIVTMAVASYQRLPSRWGDDADIFNPTRWLDDTTHQEDALSPYANLLSFNAGPRICLGWRFALLEMQVILSELVGKFSFVELENEGVRAKHLTNLLPVAANGDRAIRLHIPRVL